MSNDTMTDQEDSVKPEDQALTIVSSQAEPESYVAAKGYEGAGTTILTPEQSKALMEPFKDEEHDIKPTAFGEVYVSHVHIRRRLNTVIGAGQWALVPVTDKNGTMYWTDKGNTVCYRGRLYIRGNFVAEAVGEQTITSDGMTYASACEGARSDALTRCCKDMSIGWECWDRSWTEAWKRRFAVRVAYKRKGETKYGWRRKDASPMIGEVPMGRQTVPEPEAEPDAPKITKEQQADLWAVATEQHGRKHAEEILKTVLKAHGYKGTSDIAAARYDAVLAAVKGAK